MAAATIAVLFSITASVLYNWNNYTGTAQANVSSWAVWSFITILNFTSYRKMTGDWVKSVLPVMNSIGCILTLLLALRHGTFRALGHTDLSCLVIGILAGICWWTFKRKSYAEVIVQILLEAALVIGFVPTIAGLLQKNSHEPFLPWAFWTASFMTQYFAVRYTWRGKYIDFLYPVNMALFHGAVLILALT